MGQLGSERGSDCDILDPRKRSSLPTLLALRCQREKENKLCLPGKFYGPLKHGSDTASSVTPFPTCILSPCLNSQSLFCVSQNTLLQYLPEGLSV